MRRMARATVGKDESSCRSLHHFPRFLVANECLPDLELVVRFVATPRGWEDDVLVVVVATNEAKPGCHGEQVRELRGLAILADLEVSAAHFSLGIRKRSDVAPVRLVEFCDFDYPHLVRVLQGPDELHELNER